MEEYLERESAQEFWPLGPEPVVNLLQKSLGLKAKLAGFGSGDATRNVIHRSVPARSAVLEVIGRVRPTTPARLCKSNEGQAMVVGAVDSLSVGADKNRCRRERRDIAVLETAVRRKAGDLGIGELAARDSRQPLDLDRSSRRSTAPPRVERGELVIVTDHPELGASSYVGQERIVLA